MKLSAKEQMAALSIGTTVMRYLKEEGTGEEIVAGAEFQAMQTLQDILSILDDKTLDDPSCFRRIEAILRALERNGLSSFRHDW